METLPSLLHNLRFHVESLLVILRWVIGIFTSKCFGNDYFSFLFILDVQWRTCSVEFSVKRKICGLLFDTYVMAYSLDLISQCLCIIQKN